MIINYAGFVYSYKLQIVCVDSIWAFQLRYTFISRIYKIFT